MMRAFRAAVVGMAVGGLLAVAAGCDWGKSSTPTFVGPPPAPLPPEVHVFMPCYGRRYPINSCTEESAEISWLVDENTVLTVHGGVQGEWDRVEVLLGDEVIVRQPRGRDPIGRPLPEPYRSGAGLEMFWLHVPRWVWAGRQGRQVLRLRVWNGTLVTEVPLEVRVDPAELERRAIDYIREHFVPEPDPAYWHWAAKRFSDTRIYFINRFDPAYQWMADVVLALLERWTGVLRFVVVADPPGLPWIRWRELAAAGAGEAAVLAVDTRYGRGYFIVTRCEIRFDRGAITKPAQPWGVMASIGHESMHCLGNSYRGCDGFGHTRDNSIISMCEGNYDYLILHPRTQRALQLVYTHPPGHSWR